MPLITPSNLPSYVTIFLPLYRLMADSLTPTDELHVTLTGCTVQTFQRTWTMVRQRLSQWPDARVTTLTRIEVEKWSCNITDEHSLRFRRQKGTTTAVTCCFDYTSGTLASIVRIDRPLPKGLNPSEDPKTLSTRNILEEIPYTEETFYAFCHIKNLDLIYGGVIIHGIKVEALPDYSKYTNIAIVQNDHNSIVIL